MNTTSSNNLDLLDQEEEAPIVREPSFLRFVELCLGGLALLGVLLSLMLVPGHGPLLAFSICSLTLFYSFLGFIFFNGIKLRKVFSKSSYRGISAGRIIGAIGAGYALSVCLTGILFKLMFWPGAQIMIRAGLFFMLPVIVVGSIKYASSRSPYYKNIFIRVLFFGSFGLALYFTQWVEVKYRNHPAYIKAFNEYNNDPTAENKERMNEERNRVYDEENY